MSGSSKKPIVRLEAASQGGARLEVDRTFPGRIRGVSVLTTGPALGHGFDVDRTTVEQVARLGAGVRGRWTHGGLSDDGLGRHLGVWENIRLEAFRLCRACSTEVDAAKCVGCGADTTPELRAIGDFAFAPTAHKIRPDGLDVPAPVYLMDRAEEDPESLGISVVARFAFEELKGESEEEPRRLARIEARTDLKRADWVADPAANPVGLHEGTGAPSELTEGATKALDRIVAREGVAKARLRAFAFLARYFGDAGDDEDAEPEGELAELRAEVERLRGAERERRQREDAAFVERLRTESVAAQAPIPPEDMERVAALMRDGQAETAKVLGEAFLARSRAEGQVAFRRGAPLPLQPPGDDRAKSSVEAQASVLRRRGWDVKVKADGSAIERAVPPSAAASERR